MLVKKTDPRAIIPEYKTPGSVGLDLHLLQPTLLTIEPQMLRTGIAIQLPPGFEGQIRPRSSASKAGVVIPIGTIDTDYRGELHICAYLNDDFTLNFKAGDRIAQLVISPVQRVEIEVVEMLEETVRGVQGWGSTGD